MTLHRCSHADKCTDEKCPEKTPHEVHLIDDEISCNTKSYCYDIDAEVRCVPIDNKEIENNEDLLGTEGFTNSGFGYVSWEDTHENKCSLQISSAAVFENEDGTVDNPLGWIWLGIDNPNPQIMKRDAEKFGLELPPGPKTGWMPYPIPDEVLISTRMHLNEKQVRGLIKRLQTWLGTGGSLSKDS